MKPTTSPTLAFSPCSVEYDVKPPCFDLASLVFWGGALLD